MNRGTSNEKSKEIDANSSVSETTKTAAATSALEFLGIPGATQGGGNKKKKKKKKKGKKTDSSGDNGGKTNGGNDGGKAIKKKNNLLLRKSLCKKPQLGDRNIPRKRNKSSYFTYIFLVRILFSVHI